VGTALLVEGQRMETIHLLSSGQVEVTRSGVTLSTLSVKGQPIGLAAALTRGVSKASATVVEGAELLALSTREFWDLQADIPELSQALVVSVATFLLEVCPYALQS
jgi:CRP-like cAMP-binding protein